MNRLKDVNKLHYHSRTIVNVCLDDNDCVYFKTPIVFSYCMDYDNHTLIRTCILENEI